MENDDFVDALDHGTPKVLRSLVEFASSSELSGFDQIYEDDSTVQPNEFQFLSLTARETEEAAIQVHDHQSKKKSSRRMHSVSISMPASPLESHFQTSKQLLFSDHGNTIPIHRYGDSSAPPRVPISRLFSKQVKYDPRIGRMKDTRFDSFKTWSGKLEKQLSNLRGKPQESRPEDGIVPNAEIETLPVERYFDALEGPELDTLRASEEIVLPHDKPWPFLLRYPVSSFGICLGISSQAILWKSLATSPSMKFLHIDLTMNLILWCISVALVSVVSLIYLMKVIFYFEAVRREYHHPVRVNFFFAPWISLLFLAIGSPPSVVRIIPVPLWYTLMVPIFCLELKIYGQWMLGGQRRLSRVANPSNHLSVIGNFVGAFLGASMGLREGPIFFFAVGLAHYAVLFVTLYQRLPTNETLPKELHPVFFLFVAAPSVASMAWAKIQGTFDHGSRIAYFTALFLYFLLAVRVNFFRGFRFSLAWWAYTFPMTSASIATITYANEVSSFVTQSLSVILFLATTITVTALLMTTMVHAFVLQDLFPNDIAIAISEKRCGRHRKNQHRRQESLKAKGTESFSRFGSSESKDIEASLRSPMDDAGAV